MNLETSEIILKDLKRSARAETRRLRPGSLMKIHMIFIFSALVRSDNQKVSLASSLTLSRNPFVLTFTEQQAA